MALPLRECRARIKSTESMKKITRAMELIAASRIIKAQQRAQQAAPSARGPPRGGAASGAAEGRAAGTAGCALCPGAPPRRVGGRDVLQRRPSADPGGGGPEASG